MQTHTVSRILSALAAVTFVAALVAPAQAQDAVARSPYGADDERGLLNEMTDQQIVLFDPRGVLRRMTVGLRSDLGQRFDRWAQRGTTARAYRCFS